MTNIPRAPFYVPRHSDDQLWMGPPSQRSGPMTLTLTQAQLFGQHGQAVDYNFAPAYTFDDPAPWSGEPDGSYTITLLSAQRVHGAGGEVQARNFAPLYTIDDAVVWSGGPVGGNRGALNSLVKRPFVPVLPQLIDDPAAWSWPTPQRSGPMTLTLTQVKFFGQSGQVPTRSISPFYPGDDAAAWSGSPLAQNAALNVVPLAGGTFYAPRPSDDPVWSGAPLSSMIIRPLLTAVGQVQSRQWLPGLDDPAPWSGSPVSSNIIRPLLTASGQPPTKNWSPIYTLDDASVWSGSPLGSVVVHPLLTAAGKPPQPRRTFDFDDAAAWGGSPLGADSALLKTLVVLNPFTIRSWLFGYDDAAPWSGAPLSSGAISATRTQQKAYGQPGQVSARDFAPLYAFDDPASWSGSPLSSPHSLVTTLVFYVPVAYARPWQFGVDDHSIWTPQPYNNNKALQFTSLIGQATARWAYTTVYDESAVWPGGPRPTSSLLTAVPLLGRRWLNAGDDLLVWQGTLRSVPMTLGGKTPFLSPRWSFASSDELPWSMTYQQSLSLKVMPPPQVFQNVSNLGGTWGATDAAPEPLMSPRSSAILYLAYRFFSFFPARRRAVVPAQGNVGVVPAQGNVAKLPPDS